jgi:hypothetical protein
LITEIFGGNTVKHVAAHDDTAGFDIRSFDDYGKDRFIEVKNDYLR